MRYHQLTYRQSISCFKFFHIDKSMIRFGVLILVLLASFTISLPTCNISYWVDLKNTTCSASPNGTYSALTYNGNCSLSPDDPSKTSYKLIINTDTKIVQNFTVYDGNACPKGDQILFAKTPLSLDSCGILYYMTTSSSFVEVGNLVFSCKD